MKYRLTYNAARGEILNRNGQQGANWYLLFVEKTKYGETKNVEFPQGIAVSWVSNKCPRFSTASYAWVIQALFYGFDMARMLIGLLSELMFGNMGRGYPHMYETIIQTQRTE